MTSAPTSLKSPCTFIVAVTTSLFALSGNVHAGGGSVYVCPWADNVILIEFDSEAGRLTYRDAAESLSGGARAVWHDRQVGAASIRVLTWSGGWIDFELEDWGHGYKLRNTRVRYEQVWRDYGWCFTGDDLP